MIAAVGTPVCACRRAVANARREGSHADDAARMSVP